MYILEGNIGAGKSTLLNMIKDASTDIDVVFEPVNAWHKQDVGQSLLAQFYNDIPRWAFTLETYAMICRIKEHLHEQKNHNPYRLFERSIYSGHYCFAHNSYSTGGMTSMEWDIYQNWFTFLMRNKCRLPFGFIYLKTKPTICFERIKKRARPGEDGITLEYLEHISKRHDDLLLNKIGLMPELSMIPVLVLDGNIPFLKSSQLFNEYCDQIDEFMHKTQCHYQSATHIMHQSL